DLEAALVERPMIEPPLTLLVEGAVRALTDKGVAVDLAHLLSSADVLSAFYRWEANRPQLSVAASDPLALGLPGVVTIAALWHEQTYRLDAAPMAVRERRGRASLGLADWIGADTRAGFTLALDDWSGRGRTVSVAGELERRLFADRVAVGGRRAGYWS